MWKGDDVGYFALHAWIRRNKPKSEVCESCGKKKKLDAANISGKYKRDVNDFKWLCRKCHLESDERMKNNLKHFEKGNMIGFETRFKKKESFIPSEEVFKSHPEPKEKGCGEKIRIGNMFILCGETTEISSPGLHLCPSCSNHSSQKAKNEVKLTSKTGVTGNKEPEDSNLKNESEITSKTSGSDTLSDFQDSINGGDPFYWEQDVKEFILRLKEELLTPNNKSKNYIDFFEVDRKIDKLAGDDLL